MCEWNVWMWCYNKSSLLWQWSLEIEFVWDGIPWILKRYRWEGMMISIEQCWRGVLEAGLLKSKEHILCYWRQTEKILLIGETIINKISLGNLREMYRQCDFRRGCTIVWRILVMSESNRISCLNRASAWYVVHSAVNQNLQKAHLDVFQFSLFITNKRVNGESSLFRNNNFLASY